MLMTPKEAAALLKVTPETVKRWLRKGELAGSNTPAGWRIAQADIDAWLAKYRQEAAPSAELPPWAADLKPWEPNKR